jgi:hypothetical protein
MRLAVPTRGASVKGDEKMVAVLETDLGLPVGVPRPADGEPVEAGRRVVAVAVSPMELLRPGSDLLSAIRGAGYVDLLLACEDEPVADPSPVGVLGGGPLEPSGHDLDDCLDDDADEADDVRAAVTELGLDELHVHRLGLRPPLGTAADGDLVAALSELVGFDPEPGVQCLAPAPLPSDPARAAIERAVWRIAQVYSLPVQRYRCLELSVVDD